MLLHRSAGAVWGYWDRLLAAVLLINAMASGHCKEYAEVPPKFSSASFLLCRVRPDVDFQNAKICCRLLLSTASCTAVIF